MRFARKLMLLALAAIAALAFAAPASATDKVQVVNEKTGAVCGDLGKAPCEVHAVGTATLRVDLVFFEAAEATCNLEVQQRIDGDGDAEVYDYEHTTGPDANCATVVAECNLPHKAAGEEDAAVGVVAAQVAVCLDPAESDTNCVGNLAFNIVEQAAEHYETQFNNATVGVCELDVDLEVESAVAANAAVHVNHP